MATTQATKQVARSAAHALPQRANNVQLRAKVRTAALIDSMHRQLYPDLYKANGKMKDAEAERDNERRSKRQMTPQPAFAEDVKKYEGYTDPRIENAVRHVKDILVYKTKPSVHKTCPDPVSVVSDAQMKRLDPTGARTRLFAKTNPERAQVGDILLVRQRTGEPFAGVCINIRRRGVDTAILLRGQLTRVGVEMWFKVYSPLVEGIEVVQRAAKRARRARLTFMRKPKHDRGSVENVVRMYLRQKAALGTADGKKRGAAALGGMGKKKGNKKGNKRR